MNPPRIAAIALAVTLAGAWIATRNGPSATAAEPASSSPSSSASSFNSSAASSSAWSPVRTASLAPSMASSASMPAGRSTSAADGGTRGVVRAVREATLSSRLAARIADMPLAEGATFKAGTLLVRFDCERQGAEARAAAAVVEVQKKTVDTNEELDRFESIGKNDLAISRSVLDKARAESDAQKSQLKDCNVYAPFAGRVVERMAHNYEAVAVSQPLLKVVDTSALELDLIVPSAWLQWLAEGRTFQFRIDETDQLVAAKVLRLTPTVDPVSKTIRIIGQLTPGKGLARVLPGMSGTAVFDRAAH